MRKLLCLVLGMLFVCVQLFAQNRTISGTITDDKGNPIPNASILVKGSNTGTTTNADGKFTISVGPNTRTLLVTSVGLAEQEVNIGNRTTVNVTLNAAEQSLQEVVVNTGYTRERRSQFAGAATVLSAKVVENVPVGSFDQALQGRAPGMLVNSGSGQPGASAQITIRGVQSIQGAGAQPLYVIDGVPMPSFDMQSINPNDFESITVLKDASAAALYGARGGTGVIVITTKKGRAGATNITYRGQYGITTPPNFDRLNLMNSSEILEYEERMGLQGAPTATPGWRYSLKNPANATLPATDANPFAPSQARYNFILDSLRGINSNWRDILFRQGTSQTHEINLSGGSDKTRFFLSGSYFDQEGIDRGSSLTRYTTRFNIEHTTNKLTVALNGTVGYSQTRLSEGEWLGNSARNPFQMVYRAKPYENPFLADGSPNFGASTNLALKQVGNLLEGIQNSQWRQDQLKSNAGLTLNYELLPFLNLRNTSGVDLSYDYNTRYVNPASYIGSLQSFQAGIASEASRRSAQLINTSSAIFNKKFADIHEVEVGAYFEAVRGYQRGNGFTLYNLDPRLTETGQGAGTLPTNGAATYPQNATSAKSGFGIRSYFATGRYTYDDRYTVTANIRRDGTSRIANDDNRQITTWSAGFIWNAMKEQFLANQNVLTDLRVRGSYGIVPNIGSLATFTYGLAGLTSITNYTGPQIPGFGTTTYAGSPLTGLAPSSPGNPDYQIENVRKANLGFDFGFWKNRARFTVDGYYNKTVDLFVRQNLPAESGFASQDLNAGVMSNKGIEATVNVDVVRSRDFTLTLGANHAYNKNTIENLGGVFEYVSGTFIIREGLSYGSHYTFNYLGADPQTGRPIYETADGKTTNNLAQAGRFAKFGNYLPKHVGGFNADIRYKRFSVSALFSYQFDVVRSNNTRNWITRGTAGYHASVNGSRELLTNQWQKPGDIAEFQAVIYDRDFTSSDLEDAKFLRFRNLLVSYQVPGFNFGNGNKIIKGARIYFQGQNLAIWSPWRGVDPEDNNNISLNEYPNPTMFVGGVEINF
ncbi:SusC/RagA family TonB-linked outer membrane protein [Paracnuella aquatica]|uniref:SusC/RagA family TonB-linked outer membrane protein n=1 Tax=Paracnuella aquatica TaxID=2268757 RepID=UPI000DEFA537|nr:SusC/RagA family TonB-linked outer membrane protein [Paracnuella aquatica]RPD48188.1 SusC/RagA family TonB-linked outer membrane protein [Paracnuella aquatica]